MNPLKEIIRFKKSFLKTILVATVLLNVSCSDTIRYEDIIEDSEYDDDFADDDLVEFIDSTKNKNPSPDTISKANFDISFVETRK
jgi:hypothetical protein